MESWKLTEKLCGLSDKVPFYFFSVLFSSISSSIMMIVCFLGLSWLTLLPIIMYSVVVFISYLLFAMPLQIILNIRPHKYSGLYLIIYMFVSFVAVLLVNIIIDNTPLYLIKTPTYYALSIIFAVIYWLWDSVFLQKRVNARDEKRSCV